MFWSEVVWGSLAVHWSAAVLQSNFFQVSHYWKLRSKHQGSVMYWSWLQEHKPNLIASALRIAHWEFKVLILAELDASESYCSHPLAASFLQHRQKWTMTTASNYRLHISALASVAQVSSGGWKVCGGLIRVPFGWSRAGGVLLRQDQPSAELMTLTSGHLHCGVTLILCLSRYGFTQSIWHKQLWNQCPDVVSFMFS